MFQFVNYNFCGDIDCLNPAPSNVNNITTTKLENAIYDHFNVTRNTTLDYSTTIPTEWDYDTIMDADFNGDTTAGNVDFLADQVSSILIKRRITGTFTWLTLGSVPINSIDDINFVFTDRYNAYGVQYDYAFVPILEGAEGDYIINSILSKFNGVFISDANTIYKFLYNVDFTNNTRTQQIGTFEPLGRKYPVIVANGQLSYDTGTVSGYILNDDFIDTKEIDRIAIANRQRQLLDFLSDKKPKILKDWQSRIWLCIVTDNIQISYANGSGMGIPDISFNWKQIGDANDQQDLFNNGLVSEAG